MSTAGVLVDVRDKIGMEDEEKTRRDVMHNKLLDMGMCTGLSAEAALEIGVGSIEILGSKARDALQLWQRRASTAAKSPSSNDAGRLPRNPH